MTQILSSAAVVISALRVKLWDLLVVISEKEKQAKLKEAEIVTARSQILKLESKLTSMEHSNKRARLEFDRELESIQSEQSVRI